MFLTKNLRGLGQGLEQTYLYLWYSLIQWNKYNVRAVTIFDQRQYTISDDIQLSTIYDYLLYTISGNIRLSTIYNRQQNMLINNIQSVTLYDYQQHTENGQP